MAASTPDEFIQYALGCVAERRVSNIVSEGCRLGDFGVKATEVVDQLFVANWRIAVEKSFRQPSSGLSDFHGVREAIVKRKTFVGTDNLRHTQEPPERVAVQDSITVTRPAGPQIITYVAGRHIKTRGAVVPPVLAHPNVAGYLTS